MVKLDVVKAAFSGFGVVGRNPLAMLAWAVFILVVGFLPLLLLIGGFAGSIAQLAALEASGAEPTPEAILPLLGSVFAMIPVLIASGLVLRSVLSGAVYRAVLFPEDRSWFYLRLGARELWLALVLVVAWVILFAVSFFAQIIGSLVMLPAMMMSAGGDPENPAASAAVLLMTVPLMLGMFALFAFIYARFGLAFPMTFAQSQFRLFESWTLTRGNGWRMFLLFLLLAAVGIALYLLLWIVIAIIAVAVFGAGAAGGWSEAGIEAFFAQAPGVWMAALAPWIVLAVVVSCVAGALVTTLFTAPFADAYRQLSVRPATPEPELAA